MQYIDIIQEKVDLREGKASIEKILVFLFLEDHLSTKVLARKVLLPIPVVTAIKKEMISLGIAVQDSGIKLSAKGKKYVEDCLGYKGLNIEKFKKLKNDSSYRDEVIEQLVNKYSEIYEQRPSVDVMIDQAKATIVTTFKRAMLSLINDSIIHKRILCIGDDDLVSIGVGLLLKEIFYSPDNITSEVVALDIDERIVKYINDVASEQDIPVKANKMDFCNPLPITYIDYFDMFYTDPPYTESGMTLFLSRGVSALKKEKGLKVFLSFGQKPLNETLNIQKVISKHGLVINSIWKGYNEYEGASLLGNVSQMIVLESTDYLRNVIMEVEKYSEDIYTADFRNHVSQYKCKSCKHIFKVGKGEKISTIEELKRMRCSFCGKDTFELLKNKKEDEKKQKNEVISLGKHILADFYDCRRELLCDENLIQKIMHNAAKIANATIVEENFHKFSPWGVSGAIIIKESHLTIHTWPEHNYAAVDVFTCGESLDAWKALGYLKEHLECQKLQCNNIGRGNFVQSTLKNESIQY